MTMQVAPQLLRETLIAMTSSPPMVHLKEELSRVRAQQVAKRTKDFISMVVAKKEQLFGRSQVSPRRKEYSGRLQKNIDMFFQQK